MDHGLGAVDALLVVPHEPAPPGHPCEGALDDPAAWKDFEALRGIGPFDDFDGEVEEGGLVHELGSVVGAIGELVLEPGQRLRTLSRIICAPALSEMAAVVRLTISRRPSVSTAICRLRPTIFLPAS